MLEHIWNRLRGRENERARRELELANALPVDAAKSRALDLLHNPHHYDVSSASVQCGRDDLGPQLEKFFSMFARVEDKNGGTRIGHDYVSMSQLRPPFIRVGEDVEMHFELITYPRDDRLYWISDAVHKLDAGYKTIWHLIVSDE